MAIMSILNAIPFPVLKANTQTKTQPICRNLLLLALNDGVPLQPFCGWNNRAGGHDT